jgi:hypothetical protein
MLPHHEAEFLFVAGSAVPYIAEQTPADPTALFECWLIPPANSSFGVRDQFAYHDPSESAGGLRVGNYCHLRTGEALGRPTTTPSRTLYEPRMRRPLRAVAHTYRVIRTGLSSLRLAIQATAGTRASGNPGPLAPLVRVNK